MRTESTYDARWYRVEEAAQRLGLTPAALRSRLQRTAATEGNSVVARPGLGWVARKLGRHWRLRAPIE